MTTLHTSIYNKHFFYITTLFLFITTITFSQKNKELQKVVSLKDRGIELYKTENYEESITSFNKLLNLAQKLENDQLACTAYTMKGHIHLQNGKNKEALNNYYKALNIANRTKNIEQEILINSGLMIVLSRMNKNDKALYVAFRSKKIIPETRYYNKENHVRFLTTLCDVYLKAENYDAVLKYSEKGIVMSNALQLDELLLDFIIKKGEVFYYRKEYNTALKLFHKVQEILNNKIINNRSYPTIKIDYFIANCHYQKQLYDKTINILLYSVNCFEETDIYKPTAIRSHLLLANCYNQIHNYKQAMFWNTQFNTLNDYYLKNKDQTIDIIHQKETAQLQKEIILLKTNQTEEKKAKNLIFWILLIMIPVLIISILIFLKKQKSNTVVFQNLM